MKTVKFVLIALWLFFGLFCFMRIAHDIVDATNQGSLIVARDHGGDSGKQL